MVHHQREGGHPQRYPPPQATAGRAQGKDSRERYRGNLVWEAGQFSCSNVSRIPPDFTTVVQNDMLEWVLEQAIPRNSSDESITSRILLVNFAAIHTSSNVSPPSPASVYTNLTHMPPGRRRASLTRYSTLRLRLSICNLCVRRSSRSSRRGVGRRQRWARCGSSTASCASLSGSTASVSVRPPISSLPLQNGHAD